MKKPIAFILLVGCLSAHGAITQVNIKSFGAKGNGVSIDDAAFTAAIAVAGTNVATIYIPPGTYLISKPITITNNTELTLAGDSTLNSIQPLSGTIIKLADEADCDMLVKTPTGRVNLKGLVFDGNKSNQTSTNLHGIWLVGTNTATTRCSVDDVVVWNVSGVGIKNDNRESHFSRVHVSYSESDGIQNTATSDTDWHNILSGFNQGNGFVQLGAGGFGANNAYLTFCNFYRNGQNGLLLTNSANSTYVHVIADANVKNGILAEGFAWRNAFIGCQPIVNNYYLDHDGLPTTEAAGTYANVMLKGGGYVYDWSFIGCTFFQYESTELANHGGMTVGYQIDDQRTGFTTTKYARMSFSSCNFADGFCVTAPYDPIPMLENASGEWSLNGVPTYPHNRTYNRVTSDTVKVLNQLETAYGLQANAYYSSGWKYRVNGPAYYFGARFDDPLMRIQYASAGLADGAITFLPGININSTNGFVAIGKSSHALTELEVSGNVKGDHMEVVDGGLAGNAYYGNTAWRRRGAGYAYMLQMQPAVSAMTLNVADTDAADSEITWNQALLVGSTSGNVSIPGDLSVGGILTVPTLNMDELNVDTIGVTNSITASNIVATTTINANELYATNKVTSGTRLDFLTGASIYRNNVQYVATDADLWYFFKPVAIRSDGYVSGGGILRFASDSETTITASIDSTTGNISGGIINGTNGFAVAAFTGINATVNVLVAGGTTNRMVWVGGVLVSNITNYAE